MGASDNPLGRPKKSLPQDVATDIDDIAPTPKSHPVVIELVRGLMWNLEVDTILTNADTRSVCGLVV
jgi:hypothetical protein